MSDQQHEGDSILHQDAVEDVVRDVLSESGGSGVMIVSHTFDFGDAAALLAGIEFYTPTVGDTLLNVWFEVESPDYFDVVAKADVGTFVGDPFGLFFNFASVIDLVAGVSNQDLGGLTVLASGLVSLVAACIDNGYSAVPATFNDTNPLKVCVSTTGKTDGAQIASTTGEATVKALILPAT